jgi:hypothetical protein
MKNFIIAGNYAEYAYWIKRKILSPSVHVYVTNPDTLRGVQNPHGWFIGTWYDRDDMEEIFEVLLRATDITTESHRRINALWGKWNLL